MSRPALSLLLLAALAAVLLLVWNPAPTPDDAGAPGSDAGAPPPAGALEEGGAAAPEVGRSAAGEPDAADAATPTDENGFLPPSEDPDAVLVRVVDERTRKAVAGAEVLYWRYTEDQLDRLREAFRATLDWERRMEMLGARYRTDERGVVRVPPGRENVYLAARTSDAYAFHRGWDLEPDEEAVLALRRNAHVTVRVVDPDGRPQPDVTVVYQSAAGATIYDRARARTNEEGVAVLRHLEQLLPAHDPDFRARIAAAVPLEDPVYEYFDPDDPPREVTLTLPPLGWLRVEARDHAGKPAPDELRAHVQRVDPDYPEGRFNPDEEFGHDLRYLKDGAATFPVGLNVQLEWAVNFRNDRGYVSDRGPSPALPGQTLSVTLQQKEPPPALTGRILDPQGEPLRNTRLDTCLSSGEGHNRGQRLETDEEGRFRYRIRGPRALEGDWRICTIWHRPAESPSEMWLATLDLSHDLAAGDTEVGDLRIGAPGIAASGRCVWPDGTPAAGVAMGLRWKQETPPDAGPLSWQPPPQGYLWGGRDEDYAVTDAEGGFVFRGQLPADFLELLVGHEDAVKQETRVDYGATGIEIVLQPACSLHGTVLLDEGIPPEQISLTLERRTDDARQPWDWEGKHECASAEDAFAFEGLEPGEYRLTVPGPGEGGVEYVEDLRLQPGAPHRDPRLNPLDLRGRLHPRELEVTTTTGEDVTWIWIVPLDPPGEPFHTTLPWRFVTPHPSRHDRIAAPGFRAEEVTLDEETTEVVLSPGIPVTFRLDASREEIAGHELGLVLMHDDLWSSWRPDASFDETGRMALRVPRPGEYELHVEHEYERTLPGNGETHTHQDLVLLTDGTRLVRFTVPGSSSGAEILIPIDVSDLAHDE